MPGKLLKTMAIALTVISGIMGSTEMGYAALPDEETYNFVISHYNLLIEDETNCGFYANPNTLAINGNERSVVVLHTRGDVGGSMCNCIFEFQVLTVNCRSGEIVYSPQIASPANWAEQEQRYVSRTVANQICVSVPLIYL